MSVGLLILDGFTFLCLLRWAVTALQNICSDNRRAVSFLILVFFVFYGIPIALNLTLGTPEYSSTPGFRDGADSESVAAIYDLFVLACPAFWWWTARSARKSKNHVAALAGQKSEPALWLLLCSPAIALIFAPEPRLYLSYAVVLRETLSPAASSFHGIMGGLSIIALVAGSGLLLVRRNFSRTFLLILPLITLAIWVQGKRSIVALALALIWAAAWMRGYLTRSRLVGLGTASLIIFVGYVAWYQTSYRPAAVADSGSVYENLRIDFGRDHNLKAAILCELSPDAEPILEYRGESILFYLTMYVPRSFWPDKPWPYAVYLTSHAIEREPTDLGWGLTTSFLDESIANFGWFGLLLGPATFAFVCRICDHSPDPLVKVAGVLLACLLMTVELVAFAPLAIAWVLYLFWSQRVLRLAPRKLAGARTSLPVTA